MKYWQHFKTITRHRHLVRKGCFRAGLYWQGLMHDLSKYSPTEFLVGAKYFQGNMSPNNAERMDKGYSLSWLHHKGRNRHHYEYWIDYAMTGDKPLEGMPMPKKYVVEMFVDRMSASKVYQGKKYTDRSALEYYEKGKKHYVIHPDSQSLLETLLKKLAEEGEDSVFRYIRQEVLKN